MKTKREISSLNIEQTKKKAIVFCGIFFFYLNFECNNYKCLISIDDILCFRLYLSRKNINIREIDEIPNVFYKNEASAHENYTHMLTAFV